MREIETRNIAIPVEKLLTRREWNVAVLAADGLSNKEIASKLKMTEGTAKVHLHSIFKKLRVDNRTKLANVNFQYSEKESIER